MEPVTAYYVMYGRPKRGFEADMQRAEKGGDKWARNRYAIFTHPGTGGKRGEGGYGYAYDGESNCYAIETMYDVEAGDLGRDGVARMLGCTSSDKIVIDIMRLLAESGLKKGEERGTKWPNHFSVNLLARGPYGPMYKSSGLPLVMVEKYKEFTYICSLFERDKMFWEEQYKQLKCYNENTVKREAIGYAVWLNTVLSAYLGIGPVETAKLYLDSGYGKRLMKKKYKWVKDYTETADKRNAINYDVMLARKVSEKLGIGLKEAAKLCSKGGNEDAQILENINKRKDNPIELLRAMWKLYLHGGAGEDIRLGRLLQERLIKMVRVLELGGMELEESIGGRIVIRGWCDLIYKSLVKSYEVLWYSWMWNSDYIDFRVRNNLIKLDNLATEHPWLGREWKKDTFLSTFAYISKMNEYYSWRNVGRNWIKRKSDLIKNMMMAPPALIGGGE
jgi:hypothetical protein